MKDCGACALCCKLIEVPGLAPAGVWCPFCIPGQSAGCCIIHDDRPQYCLGYDCFWRAESWPDWLRPDRCKCIFESLPGVETVVVSVEPTRPDAWKEPGVIAVIETLRKKGRPVVLKTKNDSKMFVPEGWTQQRVLRDIETVIEWKRQINDGSNIHDRSKYV